MDRQTIIEIIKNSADSYGSSNPQQIKQLTSSCKKASDRELFFGLFSFFYDPALQENAYQRQQLAGTILFNAAPECPLELDGVIYAAPKYWDLSIEELPWYICRVFGKSKVQEFLEELMPNVEEGGVKKSFETMLFWANGYK